MVKEFKLRSAWYTKPGLQAGDGKVITPVLRIDIES